MVTDVGNLQSVDHLPLDVTLRYSDLLRIEIMDKSGPCASGCHTSLRMVSGEVASL